jgi:cytochrome oxidase Cu insertion factor (SCO1/SenC/PrrC family)
MDTTKLKLSALLLMAALPISLATWYFGVATNQSMLATSNKGRLVLPVLDVTELQLQDPSGAPGYLPFEVIVEGVTPEDYEPRPWQLLYLGSPVCDAVCVDRLYFLRQMHTRLGRESDRVERVYVQVGAGQGELPQATAQLLAEQHPGMKHLNADSALLREKLARTISEDEDAIADHYIYVVDPVGNIMLYFTPDNTPEQILADLDKLLDQSSLG